MNRLIEHYNAWPRVLRWSVLAAAFFALLLAWDTFARPTWENMNAKADKIQDKLVTLRSGSEIAGQLNVARTRDAAVALGPVERPADAAEGRDALNDLVNQILDEHTIDNRKHAIGQSASLPNSTLVALAAGKRFERLPADLKFTATPSEAASVLAKLESSPKIESVDSVTFTKDANGKIRVSITFEAWVIGPDTKKPL